MLFSLFTRKIQFWASFLLIFQIYMKILLKLIQHQLSAADDFTLQLTYRGWTTLTVDQPIGTHSSQCIISSLHIKCICLVAVLSSKKSKLFCFYSCWQFNFMPHKLLYFLVFKEEEKIFSVSKMTYTILQKELLGSGNTDQLHSIL